MSASTESRIYDGNCIFANMMIMLAKRGGPYMSVGVVLGLLGAYVGARAILFIDEKLVANGASLSRTDEKLVEMSNGCIYQR